MIRRNEMQDIYGNVTNYDLYDIVMEMGVLTLEQASSGKDNSDKLNRLQYIVDYYDYSIYD